MSNIVYLNGKMVHLNWATVSVMDYGFLYGFSLFETMRSYRGRVFRMERHLERLVRSAEILGINVPIIDWKGMVMDTLHANKLEDARIRITISAGEGGSVPDPASCEKPTVLILASAYTPFPAEVYEKGFRAIFSSIHRNSQSPLSGIKSANYLESLLARQEARKAATDEAVCLNEKGLLAEASMSNIFLVTSDILKTPGLASGILPGITRETVIELAAQSGIEILEQDINPDELVLAEEAFLTNSLMEVMPLTTVGDKPVGSGRPGEITLRLMSLYKELVATETA